MVNIELKVRHAIDASKFELTLKYKKCRKLAAIDKSFRKTTYENLITYVCSIWSILLDYFLNLYTPQCILQLIRMKNQIIIKAVQYFPVMSNIKGPVIALRQLFVGAPTPTSEK